MRAALYERVSTDQQAERYGLGAQDWALKERAKERSYALVPDGEKDAFVDDGYSGGDLDRPALKRLRQALTEGRVDVLLCYDPDRFSRSLSDLLLLTDEVERARVRLEFITQETDSSPEGRMFFAIRGAVAEYEKAKIRERTARGRQEKARRGKVVNPRTLPKWLRYDRPTETVHLDEEWAQVARLAFSLAQAGATLKGIAAKFQELGITTPTGGSHWQASTVSSWLRNRAAKGEYYQLRCEQGEAAKGRNPSGHLQKAGPRKRPREEWAVVPVPPVVSPNLWEAVQRRLDQNKALASRNTRRHYLLQGLVFCGACGARMRGRTRASEPGEVHYYQCGRAERGKANKWGEWCQSRWVRGDSLEAQVWRAVTGLLREPETLRAELRRRREQGSPTRELAEQELRAARKRLGAIPQEQDRLVEGYGKSLIPDDRMRARMEDLKVERETLQVRVADLERQLTRLELTSEQETRALAFAEQVRAGLEGLDFVGRQQLLRLLVEGIICEEGQATVRTIIPLPAPRHDVQLHTPTQGGIPGGTGAKPPAGRPRREGWEHSAWPNSVRRCLLSGMGEA